MSYTLTLTLTLTLTRYTTGFFGKWHTELPERTVSYAAEVCGAQNASERGYRQQLSSAHGADGMWDDGMWRGGGAGGMSSRGEGAARPTMVGQRCLSLIVRKQGGFDHAGEVYASNDATQAGGHRPECMADR